MSKTNIGEIWSIVRNMAKTDTEFREAIREIVIAPTSEETDDLVQDIEERLRSAMNTESGQLGAQDTVATACDRLAYFRAVREQLRDALGDRAKPGNDVFATARQVILEYRNHLCSLRLADTELDEDSDRKYFVKRVEYLEAQSEILAAAFSDAPRNPGETIHEAAARYFKNDYFGSQLDRLAKHLEVPLYEAVDKALEILLTDCEGCEGGKIVTEIPAGHVTIEVGELNRLRGIAARIDSVERDRSHYRDKAEDEERRRLEVEAALGNIFKVLMRDYGITPTSSENTATLAVRFLTEYKHSAHSPGTAEFLDKIIQLSTANAMLGQQFEDARLRVNALPSQQMFDDAMSRVRELEERFGSIALAMQELGIEQKDWMTNRSSQDLEQEPLHEAVIRHLRSAYGDELPTDV